MQNNIHTSLSGKEEHLAQETLENDIERKFEIYSKIIAIMSYLKDPDYLEGLYQQLEQEREEVL